MTGRGIAGRVAARRGLAVVLAVLALLAPPAFPQGGAPGMGAGSTAERASQAGCQRYDAQDYPGALAHAEAGLREDPNHIHCLWLRGACRLQLGDAAAALPDLQRAVRSGPALPLYHLTRGMVFLKLGDLAQAESDFWVALVLDPKYWLAAHDLGAVAVERKDFVGARAWYAKSLELNPQNPAAYFWRGKCSRELHDHSAALADLTRYIALAPDRPEGYQERAAVHEAMGDSVRRDADLAEAVRRGGATPALAVARVLAVDLVHNVRHSANPQSPIGLEFDVNLQVTQSRGKPCELGIAFYGPDGRALSGRTAQYRATTGELCTYVKFTPDTDPANYPRAYLWIPYSEFVVPLGQPSITVTWKTYVYCYERRQYLAEPRTGTIVVTR